jgi:hypothetical protein
MRNHRTQPSSTRHEGWPVFAPSASQTIRQAKRRAREKEIALSLLIVLAAVEILRRAPRWVLVPVGLLLAWAVLLIAQHIRLVDAVLACLVAIKLARGAVEGWRSWDDIPY